MRAFTLMPLFSIILLIGGQAPFLPNYVYASHCCGCTCKPWMCACMGTSHCPRLQCHTDDSSNLQAETVTNSQTLDISSAYSSSPSRATKSLRMNRLISIASFTECAGSRSPLTGFQSVQESLKFESYFLNYHVSEEDTINIAVNQMPGNE
jgi:hypothetical protein